MSRSMKKFFAFFLALMLVLSMTSVIAFADDVAPVEANEENAEAVSDSAQADDSGEPALDAEEAAVTEETVEAVEEAEAEDPDALAEDAQVLAATKEEETAEVPATPGSGVTVTVLHTNDVHCGIDGYAKLAAYRDSLKASGKNVILVDAGDHVQGEPIGVITKGEEIIKLMNGVGYDVAAPGNHEFDYQMDQFLKNVEDANYPYISANFRNADGSYVSSVRPYFIKEVGGKKVAFVGISTPETYTKSTPVYFQDGNGNWVYTFSEDTSANPGRFYSTIQQGINEAKAAGADVVIALAHTGMDGTQVEWNSQSVIANTTGLDAYIDGHSHEVVAGPDYKGTTFTNKDGKAVPYAQTGTKLANIGEMTITIADDGSVSVSTSLVAVENLTDENESVKALIDAANQKVEDYLGEIVGTAEVELTTTDADGNRIVRNSETNLGDFNADAFRWITGADIALVNSGGVRKNLAKGDVSRADLVAVNPFGNEIVKIEATGQQILDALEHGSRNYPGENGGFFQVSGLTYEIYEHVPTPVQVDEQGMFLGVEAGKARRVANVMVGGEPIDPAKTYTVGGTSYILQLSGDGMAMFKDCTVISDAYPNDSNSVVQYVVDGLNGKITATSYGNERGQGRITIHDSSVHLFDETNPVSVETKGDEIHTTYKCVGCNADADGNLVPCTETKVVITKVESQGSGTSGGSNTSTNTSTGTNTTKTASNNPKTGDSENAALYIVLFASALGTGVAAAYRRKADRAA